MLETLIVLGAASIVFLLFMLVFFYKDRRERATGRRSGCQAHAQDGGRCRCQGHGAIAPKPDALILDHKCASKGLRANTEAPPKRITH